MREWRGQRYLTGALGAALVAVGPAVNADPVVVDVFTTARYSDNVGQQSDENARSDIEYRTGFRVTHNKDPGQCNSRLGAELAYLMYQDQTYDNDIEARLDWNGDCEITPYLRWQASDTLQQVQQSARGSDNPENRERKNVFSTGPQLIIPLTRVDTLVSSVEWEKSTYEESEDEGSERWVGDVSLRHVFSPTLGGSLNAQYSQAEIDSGEELTEESYTVGLSQRLLRTTVSGEIGVSRLESDINGNVAEEEGVIWNGQVSHNFGTASVYGRVSHELTDTSTNRQFAFGGIRFNLLQSEAVELTTYTVGGAKRLDGGYTVDGSIFRQEYVYIRSGDVEESTGFNVGVGKALTSLLSANASLSHEWQTFEPSGDEGNETTLMLGLDYQRTEDLSLSLQVAHETQTADGSVAEYDENWVAATITYNLR